MDGDVGTGGTRDDPSTDPAGDDKNYGVYTTPRDQGDDTSSDDADGAAAEDTSTERDLTDASEDPVGTVDDTTSDQGSQDDGLLGTSLPEPGIT